jgi:hypothetical protein
LHSRPQIVIKAGAGRAKTDRKPLFPSFGRSDKTKPAQVETETASVVAPAVEPEPAPLTPAFVEDAAELEHRRRIANGG